MKKTTVIILNWNGRKLLEQFLPSVMAHSNNNDTEVAIADNASTDDSVEFVKANYPTVRLIILDKNYGFAEGYNRAIDKVDSEYVVLLNSDIETTENWLSHLTDYLDKHPDVCAVQPKILSQKQKNYFEYAGASGGFIDKFGYPFCRGRVLNHVEMDNGQYDTPIPVFWATGACLCIRREAYIANGGLDARFFAHMEEIDLCWRLHARGYQIMCLPRSVVYHVGGASLNKDNPRKTYLNFRNNLLMLYKNTEPKQFSRLIAIRTFLDALAMLNLALQNKWRSAKAVLLAHRDFYQLKSQFAADKAENLSLTTSHSCHGKFNGSILWNYYFKGRKTFESIYNSKKQDFFSREK